MSWLYTRSDARYLYLTMDHRRAIVAFLSILLLLVLGLVLVLVI